MPPAWLGPVYWIVTSRRGGDLFEWGGTWGQLYEHGLTWRTFISLGKDYLPPP